MKIEDLSVQQLKNLIANYTDKGVTTGGGVPLDACQRELARRQDTDFGVAETFDAIIELAGASETGATTYKALHDRLSGGKPWKGNHTQQNLGNALGKVVARCVEEGLPVLTVLVLPQGGTITPEAMANIHGEARRQGVNTALTPEDFYAEQFAAATRLIRERRAE